MRFAYGIRGYGSVHIPERKAFTVCREEWDFDPDEVITDSELDDK
jgi:hypothetical protein